MRSEMPWRGERVSLGAMLLAAGLALWLLLQPALVRELPLALRLPMIGLGVWALGAAFLQPLGLELRRRWMRWASTPPVSLWALATFTLLLVLRALSR